MDEPESSEFWKDRQRRLAAWWDTAGEEVQGRLLALEVSDPVPGDIAHELFSTGVLPITDVGRRPNPGMTPQPAWLRAFLAEKRQQSGGHT